MAKRHSYPPIEPGQVFHRWTVLYKIIPQGKGRVKWWCRCKCRTEGPVYDASLKNGLSKSCGCLKKERAKEIHTKHGMSSRRKNGYDIHFSEYRCWSHIQQRTTNPRNHAFSYYGGRGIKMCKRWLNSFQAFFEDMGPKPTPKHTIDRTNNDGHYSCGKCEECVRNGWPANCRWATRKEQQNNRRGNHLITYQDKTLTVVQWAEELGVHGKTLNERIASGFSLEKALSSQKNVRGPYKKKLTRLDTLQT